MAHDINPQLDVRVFDQGLNARNLDPFLADAQLYLDGLDFFALDIRRQVFAECERRRIPAVAFGTGAPIRLAAQPALAGAGQSCR